MRAFVSIGLPDDAKAALLEAQSQLSTAAAKMNLAHDFHLTLKFLGEISPEKAEAVKNCLGRVKFRSFSAAIAGIGVFPSEDYVRVVWAGIEPEDSVVQLQQKIDGALEKEFPKEKGFKPHLTLARVKLVSDKGLFKRQLPQVQLKRVNFEVKEFRLRKSTLIREGAAYEDLAVYGLG
ncbi:RNA 2',3'-cyclic phosphodiesterase [Candidatus Woesearchaeota archaeon]|nr:RNA 2',3'-cyclic phosphodiesterase [Candidatus Woesearchaeota archaeon]